MLSTLFLINLWLQNVYSESNLQCNGVELNISNLIIGRPAGVCMAFDSEAPLSSYRLDCLNDGKMYRFEYSSLDCSGPSSDTVPADTYYSADYYGSKLYDSYDIICNMEPCKYINKTIVNQTFNNFSNCNQFNHNLPSKVGWSRDIFIQNYCKKEIYSSTMWTFDGVNAEELTWYNDNCDGDILFRDIYNISDNQCIMDYPDVSSVYVLQGTAADSSNISPPSTTTTTTTTNSPLNGLKCNGAEVIEDDIVRAIPEGVCNLLVDEGISFKLLCNDDDDVMYYYEYSSKDCTRSTLLHHVCADQHFGVNRINTVCNMDKCKYIDMKVYNISFDSIDSMRECQMFDTNINNSTQQILVEIYIIENYCNIQRNGPPFIFIYDGKNVNIMEYSDNSCDDDSKISETSIDISSGQNQCLHIPHTNITFSVDIKYSATTSSKSHSHSLVVIIIITVCTFLTIVIIMATILGYIAYKKRRVVKTVENIAFDKLNEQTETVQAEQ